MKDYYYFLGVPPKASQEVIKQAYRKLSLKYHPDKNEGDDFFAARFREMTEAYETLGDPERRRLYDGHYRRVYRRLRSDSPPLITQFSMDKVEGEVGEKLVVKWRVENADVVKLLPFGLVESSGEREFQIETFHEGEFKLLLHAQNTFLRQTAVRALVVKERKTHDDLPQAVLKEKAIEPGLHSLGGSKGWLWGLVVLVVLILIFFGVRTGLY
ncbi:J domain-containing protein [Bergeyella sp. RCAD1439]|uniref:J domain-containing protein n=1 Tax=Bergeyella anatis TaxID=3113737 RepID=UPI002E182413|nr:J domain-containing protein [Bergeyella sp. RCAD1439]